VRDKSNGPEIALHFGALSPSVSEQLSEQGLTVTDEKFSTLQWDKDAEAITRLYLRGLLTDSQKQAAHKKLFNKIKKGVVSGG
jgi:hypothetical protein